MNKGKARNSCKTTPKEGCDNETNVVVGIKLEMESAALSVLVSASREGLGRYDV